MLLHILTEDLPQAVEVSPSLLFYGHSSFSHEGPWNMLFFALGAESEVPGQGRVPLPRRRSLGSAGPAEGVPHPSERVAGQAERGGGGSPCVLLLSKGGAGHGP
jgi:hypothetical protein